MRAKHPRVDWRFDPTVSSAGMTVDIPCGPVDLVAIDRALTGHRIRLSPAEVERRPAVPIKYDVEGLGQVVDPTREQQKNATTVVLNHLGGRNEAWDVLCALFQPVRQTGPTNTGRTHESVRRQEKVGKMRRWMDEEGLPLTPGGFVSRSAEAAYDRAHPEGF